VLSDRACQNLPTRAARDRSYDACQGDATPAHKETAMNTIPDFLQHHADRRRQRAPRRGFPWPLRLPMLPAPSTARA
jgi:hypothetical protein